MIRYLLDTNVVSELRKTKPHGAVLAWLDTLRPEQIFLSSFTLGEMQAGVEKTRQQDKIKALQIESWLEEVESLFSFLPADAACFRERARLMKHQPDSLRDDAIVAATACIHGLTVATRNEKDFQRLGVEVFNPFKFKTP
ncbi:MAG TPA: type II toxin-antitoxin system VapC family toxin [Candidatus Sulfotelmatobacter sp.]